MATHRRPDLLSAYLFIGCIGAAAHIVRPCELGERIPAPEQIRIGLIAGGLAAAGLAPLSTRRRS